jgi:hypothetical protein
LAVGIFNSGTDQSVVIVDNTTGQPINIGGALISFKHTELTEEIIMKPIDGPVQHRQDHAGHDIDMVIGRQTGQIDLYTATLEQEFYARIAQRSFTVTETIINFFNGSTTTNVFQNCTLRVPEHGDFVRDKQTDINIKIWGQLFNATGG